MAEGERPRVENTLRAEVSADLHAWAARYPLFAPLYFPSLAATAVAYLPLARRVDRTLVALVSLWIVTFDALVDEGDTSRSTLAALALRYSTIISAIAADQGPCQTGPYGVAGEGPFDQLDAALREIVALLATYRTTDTLRAWWEDSCRATIVAIVRQRDLGREGPLPGYAAALPLLVDSIGVEPYLAVGAIIGHEAPLEGRLEELKALARECALAIRLANDLGTWQKDEREGGFNTLVALRAEVVRATPDLPPAIVSARALAQLESHLALSRAGCHNQLKVAMAGATESAMVRLMDIVVGMYAVDEYPTYREREN
jgi:hypothetical protein